MNETQTSRIYTHNRMESRYEVLRAFGLSLKEINGRGRSKSVVAARHTIAAISMHLCGMSSTEAAIHAGLGSHSSALYASRRFLEGQYDAYPVSKKYRSIITEDQQ